MNIEIISENEHFFVINKPASLACHGPSNEPTLIDYLKEKGLPLLLCHRLDKDTSGLLIIAKTEEVAAKIGKLFENNTIEKYYLALSHRKGKKKQGTIKGFIDKGRNGNWKMTPNSRQKVCTQFFSFSLIENKRLFIVKPLTGRTHQIRVALKANGSPIIGDNRYGGEAGDRLFLHAFGIKFELDNKEYQFISIPDFENLNIQKGAMKNFDFNDISNPWSLDWPKK